MSIIFLEKSTTLLINNLEKVMLNNSQFDIFDFD